MKRTGRKAELRRLAAKHGWRDGHDGAPPNQPRKCVMLPSGEFGYNSVPADEERAYWDAYEAGKYAPANSENPYATSNVEAQARAEAGEARCSESPGA